MQVAGQARRKGVLKPLGLLAIVVLLVADFAFAKAGLPLLAPVSATISVPGTWVLICISSLGFIALIVRQSVSSNRRAINVGAWGLGACVVVCATYLVILQFGSPFAETEATNRLAQAIANPGRLEFDPRIAEADRRAVLQSKPSDWHLYFSNPMFVGYDFNLPTRDGRYIGARVMPPTIWTSNERIWVFPEVSRVAR